MHLQTWAPEQPTKGLAIFFHGVHESAGRIHHLPLSSLSLQCFVVVATCLLVDKQTDFNGRRHCHRPEAWQLLQRCRVWSSIHPLSKQPCTGQTCCSKYMSSPSQRQINEQWLSIMVERSIRLCILCNLCSLHSLAKLPFLYVPFVAYASNKLTHVVSHDIFLWVCV